MNNGEQHNNTPKKISDFDFSKGDKVNVHGKDGFEWIEIIDDEGTFDVCPNPESSIAEVFGKDKEYINGKIYIIKGISVKEAMTGKYDNMFIKSSYLAYSGEKAKENLKLIKEIIDKYVYLDGKNNLFDKMVDEEEWNIDDIEKMLKSILRISG